MDWLTPELLAAITALIGAVAGSVEGRRRGARKREVEISQDPHNDFASPLDPTKR